MIIIGVGLLGGSLGLAVKKYGLAQTVIGVGRSEKTLEIARQRQIIDQSYTRLESVPLLTPSSTLSTTPSTTSLSTPSDSVSNLLELVIICTPVAEIAGYAERVFDYFGNTERLLVTDVGSTKEKLTQKISDPRFIGSHPIAGSERSGPEVADADLFRQRLTVLTPRGSHSAKNLILLRRFWESVGSQVVEMDAAKHDAILARTSHLPHLISAVLARTLSDDERLFAGTGFARMTRLAAGSPEIWRDVLSENSDNILLAFHRFEQELQKFANAMKSKNTEKLEKLLRLVTNDE
jgi:prephenate dehydrogenase